MFRNVKFFSSHEALRTQESCKVLLFSLCLCATSLCGFDLESADHLEAPLYDENGHRFASLIFSGVNKSYPKLGFLSVDYGQVLSADLGFLNFENKGSLSGNSHGINLALKRLDSIEPNLDKIGITVNGKGGFTLTGFRLRLVGSGFWEISQAEVIFGSAITAYPRVFLRFSDRGLAISDMNEKELFQIYY